MGATTRYSEVGRTALAVHLREAVDDAALAVVLGLDELGDLGQAVARLGQHFVAGLWQGQTEGKGLIGETHALADCAKGLQAYRRLGRLKLDSSSNGRTRRSCIWTSTAAVPQHTLARMQASAPTTDTDTAVEGRTNQRTFHLARCRRRQGHVRQACVARFQRAQHRVVGPKLVAPLRDAVGLVHDEPEHATPRVSRLRASGPPLRRRKQQPLRAWPARATDRSNSWRSWSRSNREISLLLLSSVSGVT